MPSVNGELLGDLGLADARGTGEQEVADRLVRLAQTRARHLDRGRQRLDRRVLAEDDVLEVAIEILELRAIVRGHGLRRDARHLGDDVLDLGLADGLLAARHRQDALRSARLVDDVDRLVGQMPVVDVLGRELRRRGDRARRILDSVVLLVAALEPLEDLDRLLRPSARSRRSSGSAATARGPSRRCRDTRCRSSSRCSAAGPTRARA